MIWTCLLAKDHEISYVCIRNSRDRIPSLIFFNHGPPNLLFIARWVHVDTALLRYKLNTFGVARLERSFVEQILW
jgi:hypothetical protein